MPKVFLSHAIGAARLPFSATQAQTQHSSHWADLASAYRDGLLACGEEVVGVLRPEIYQTEVARRARGVRCGDWHLAIKPIEHIRPFHGLPNVFVSDWPFPILSQKTGGISPFFNQVRLLNHAAAVACCTEATAAVLRSAGIAHALHAPPFRPALVNPDFGALAPRPATSTFTILAAAEAVSLLRFDVPLIQGFASARARNPALRLVIAVSGAAPDCDVVLRDQLLAAADVDDAERAITLLPVPFADVLIDWQAQADFFLWQGHPLGLPLPLIDASLAGLPSIAPTSAATAIGLSPDWFVPLATQSRPVDAMDEPVAQLIPLSHDVPTADGVCNALLQAAALGGEGRAAIARVARREVEHRFGLDAFRAGLQRLANRLTPGLHDN